MVKQILLKFDDVDKVRFDEVKGKLKRKIENNRGVKLDKFSHETFVMNAVDIVDVYVEKGEKDE